MKAALLSFACFLFLFLPNSKVMAQEPVDTSSVFQVETVDGNTFIGKVLSKDTNILKLKTNNLGELNIPITNVRKVVKLNPTQLKNGELWFENPHSTRYFYLPNGYGLKKGEGYYQNAWVLFNQFSYGFSDYFSLGIGMIPTFLFGSSSMPIWITPKVSIPLKKDVWNIGAGAFLGTVFGDPSTSVAGLVYGVSTFGSRDKNITFGGGYGFAGDQWGNKPILSLAGTIRTGKKHYLMTENYFFLGDNSTVALLFLGGRIVNPHLAVDYGLIIPAGPEVNLFIGIPWLSITVPFGNTKK
jgi:hypothetical protein